MESRHRRVIDISAQPFSKDSHLFADFVIEVEKQAPIKLYTCSWNNNDEAIPNIETPALPPDQVPYNQRYATGTLWGYRTLETDVIAQISHISGPRCSMETNEATLIISGPTEKSIDDFFASLPLSTNQ